MNISINIGWEFALASMIGIAAIIAVSKMNAEDLSKTFVMIANVVNERA